MLKGFLFAQKFFVFTSGQFAANVREEMDYIFEFLVSFLE
jgi:hypothetical protein